MGWPAEAAGHGFPGAWQRTGRARSRLPAGEIGLPGDRATERPGLGTLPARCAEDKRHGKERAREAGASPR